jgi:hypothetical protein
MLTQVGGIIACKPSKIPSEKGESHVAIAVYFLNKQLLWKWSDYIHPEVAESTTTEQA